MPRTHGEISVDEQQQNGVDNDQRKTTTRKKKKKKEEEDVKENNSENVNQSVMPWISKPIKRFLDKMRKKPKSPPKICSSSFSSSSTRSGGSRKGGCFSRRRRRRKEKDGEGSCDSPTSDPNDESFTHEMLRVMIETNDFGSNDCNPHR